MPSSRQKHMYMVIQVHGLRRYDLIIGNLIISSLLFTSGQVKFCYCQFLPKAFRAQNLSAVQPWTYIAMHMWQKVHFNDIICVL